MINITITADEIVEYAEDNNLYCTKDIAKKMITLGLEEVLREVIWEEIEEEILHCNKEI